MSQKTIAIARWDWKNLGGGQFPEKPALRFKGNTFTYRQLDEKNRILAEQYARLFETGELIALWLPNCPDMLHACIAGFQTGVVPMPVNCEAKLPELIEILQRSECRYLIINADQVGKISADDFKEAELQRVWVIDRGRLDLCFRARESMESLDPGAGQSSLTKEAGLVLHTSGSSGRPKGVVISRKSLAHIIRRRIECAGMRRDSRALIASSLSHSVGLYQALAFLVTGAFFDLLESYDIAEMVEKINKHRPTHLIMVVAAFRKLLERRSITAASFADIQFAAVGADRVPEWLQEKYFSLTGRTLAVTYGMTELSWMLVNQSGSLAKNNSLGQTAPGVEIRLLDQEGRAVEDGDIGEIVARSPKMMLGYLHDQEDAGARKQPAWVASGDLAYRDEDAYFWYAGRIDDMIGLASGDLVAPLEVERVIMGIPGIGNCVVLGMPGQNDFGENGSEEPWAIVVKRDSGIDEQVIIAYLEKRLSDYKLPRKIIFLEQLPEGVSGKVSRKKLRQFLLLDDGCAIRVL